MVTILVAYDENRVIGNKGSIPWRLPEDFKHFKQTTLGCPCIMGRKTWESLPSNFKPLPGRPNLIVTREPMSMVGEIDTEYPLPDKRQPVFDFAKVPPIHLADSVERAISFAQWAYEGKEIFIIGGAQIYQYALENRLATRVLASEVNGVHEGDTFFPELPLDGIELAMSYKLLKEFNDFKIVEYAL